MQTPEGRHPERPTRIRRRDRHGRGLRGALVPEDVPLHRTRAERFDELVLQAVARLEPQWEAHLSGVEFAVEEIPPPDVPPVTGRGPVPLSRLDPGSAQSPGPEPGGEGIRREVLIKPLGRTLERVRNVLGATVLADVGIAPILNVHDLLKSALRVARAPVSAAISATARAAQERRVLIVEDSITARGLLKNILEAAGYQVQVAVDGVEAWALLCVEPFDVVVSDVEMPRMNGFDLTARIRADRRLAELPVVLVTALDSREDRERGVDVGANAYIVKRDFDQERLFEVLQRLS